ncbi:MAG: hypothetical protein JW863_15705 [Chitinispirillaceae bacterium]|nr:hypothetical protein [Chitinispirillaceae bacterium]
MERNLKYPKKVRKELRQLAGIAYDRDMEKALCELESHFRRWRAGEISPHDLNNLIHKHHDGISRELWKFYNLSPDITVPRSVVDGTIREDEISSEVMEHIAESIAFYRKQEDAINENPPDFESNEEDISGFYDDDGNKLNPDLVTKPGLCLLCKNDTDPNEEILCTLNRLDQADEESEFQCEAFEAKD